MSKKHSLMFCILGIMLFHYSHLIGQNSFTADSTDNKWFKNISAHLEVSNLSYASLKDELKASLEFEIANVNQEHFVVDLLVTYDYDEDKDPFEKTMVTDEETEAEFTFQAVDFFHDKVSYSSSYKYSQEKNTSDQTNVYDWDIAPLGVKWFLIRDNDLIRELSLDYLPAYNYHHYFTLQDDDGDGLYTPGLIPKVEKALQQKIKFVFSLSLFSGKISLKNKLVYKNQHPFTLIEDNDDDYKDLIINNKFRIQYYFTQNFSVGYKYEIDSDERRWRTQGLPKVDRIHSVTFEISWNE